MNISNTDFLIADGPYDVDVAKSIIDNIEQRPTFKFYTEDQLRKAFKTQGVDWNQITKSRDISQLTPVRRRVVNKNGTAYMKTVYVKKQDINDSSKARRFIEQNQLEQNLQVGDRVNARFKGWSTGTKYTTDNVEVTSIEDDKIKLKFTEDFHTNNQNNYVFTQGTELVIPRTSNKSWNEHMSVSKYEPPQPQVETQTPTQQKTLVESIDQISVGDNVSVMMRGDADNKIGQISYIHPTGNFIDIKIDGRKVRRKLGRFSLINEQPSQGITAETIRRLEQIPNVSFTGLSPDQIRVPTHDRTREVGTEQYRVRVSVDRFGNENDRGRSMATRTRTRPKFYQYTQREQEQIRQRLFQERSQTLNDQFGQFDFEQYVNETRQVLNDTLGDSNPTIRFTTNQHGGMYLEVRSEGLTMKRQFTPARKDSEGREVSPKKVYHQYFSLSRDKQGSGVGKKLFKALYRQYKKSGVKRIEVSANIDIGGYAWGRYGFTATNTAAESYVRMFEAKVGRTYRGQQIKQQHATKAREVFDSFYSNNQQSERFPMNLLCCIGQDNKVGKAILKNTSWGGRLDITNTAQRTHFENYIGFSD